MKKIYFLALAMLIAPGVHATVHTINVFCTGINPTTTNAVCGDSIRWQWGGCSDSTRSTTIPGCATPWALAINSVNPVYTILPCAGTYDFTCLCNATYFTGSITVTCSSTLIVTTNETDALCNGSCDGTATATASGGTPPYTFSWSPTGGTNSIATGLCPATYTVTVHDAFSALVTATVTVAQPPPMTAAISSIGELCFGDCNATATVTATGGTPGYTYSWSPTGGTGTTASNLCAGNYTCTITDSHTCTTTSSCVITQPSMINLSCSAVNASCSTCCDGSATATVSGGIAPYSFSWNTVPSQSLSTATNLCPGTYTCCVTDADGCVSCSAVTVSFVTGIQSQNSSAGFEIYPNPASMSITLTGNFGAASSSRITLYDLFGREVAGQQITDTPGSAVMDISSLPAGMYYVRVKTASGVLVKSFDKE